MIHIATIQDAEQLEILNNEFNGAGETTLEHIRSSLADNKQEVIVVDDLNGELMDSYVFSSKSLSAMMTICRRSPRFM